MEKYIKLSQGKFAIVDSDDFEKVKNYKWHLTSNKEKTHFYAKGEIG